MNVHHLELFFYVAEHRGVSAAARKIPYGIQQPAISAQIIQLEDALGTPLYHRRPFGLTPAGEKLFAAIEPFFRQLPNLAAEITGSRVSRVRIAAPETVQREYLPHVLKKLRKSLPDLSFTLVSARPDEIQRLLLVQEIDLGLTSLHGNKADGIKSREFLQLPLALLVPEKSGFTKTEGFWTRDRIEVPLISLGQEDPTCRVFQAELQRRKIDWFPQLELNSVELIGRYVAEGFGVGLSVLPPWVRLPAKTRALPLADFPSVPFGALWMGPLSAAAQALLDGLESLAAELALVAQSSQT
jgi:DNA-binding transcriptional LysR family regulator